ncbi:hypothetical protein ACTUVN_005019 [Pseudomonas caspiana]
MSTAFPTLYTNEVSQEFLRTLDASPLTDQQLAEFGEEAAFCVQQQKAHCDAHPPVAIYRLATEGSQTRDGGVIQHATSEMVIELSDGQRVCVAQKGDCAVYPDGKTAQIVTGAGHENSDTALVGSVLSNGDQIINTPQDLVLFVQRDGVPSAADFLPAVEG